MTKSWRREDRGSSGHRTTAWHMTVVMEGDQIPFGLLLPVTPLRTRTYTSSTRLCQWLPHVLGLFLTFLTIHPISAEESFSLSSTSGATADVVRIAYFVVTDILSFTP